MIKFIHSSDLHLGKPFGRFPEDVRVRLRQARADILPRLATLSTLLGAVGEGPAGLLWVRQGLIGLEPDGAKEKTQLMETRRDLLSSVAGEIDAMTGGRRMDRVMRRVAESLGEITTKTGRKYGAWKSVSDEADILEAELSKVTIQVQALEVALNDRKKAEAALKRLDNADAKARRDEALKTAKVAMDDANAHAGAVTTAQQERDLVSLKAKGAQSDLDAFLKSIETLKEAEVQAKRRSADAEVAKIEALRLKAALDAAQTLQKDSTVAVSEARKRLDSARSQIAARKAKQEAVQLESQIAKAEVALFERDAARAITKASKATTEWLRNVEEAQGEVSKRTAAIEARATTLSVAYDGAARIDLNGVVMPANQPITLDGESHLDLPGIGRMTIHAQAVGEEGKALLAKAQTGLDDLLSKVGAATIQDARALAASRADAEKKADMAQAVLDTLAPLGIEVLHAAKADADLAAAGAHDEPLPAISDLESRLTKSEESEGLARRHLSGVDADHASAREETVKLVRRQSFWLQKRLGLSEHPAHLVGFIMRRTCGDASAGFLVFCV